ncbi:T-box protein 2-like [Frankliniella occidentalis]|uniref:T-box protein 2-like n=1 Tax=Frankliniella occidentalis TaxID=133901 RepID=A0A9C6TYB1_FRAOC|nr:T-box protein 2-like [Frankliniella occidentalis]
MPTPLRQTYMLPGMTHYAVHQAALAGAVPPPPGLLAGALMADDVQVTLQDRELWAKFHRQGNEMIITKTGRRMFPSLRVKVSGMEADEYYFVVLEMRLAANTRFKYSNGHWVPAGDADVQPQSKSCIFVHPDSPAKGSAWSARDINFQRPNPHGAKLTNNTADTTDYNMILTSMHKYVPVIHVVRASDRAALPAAPRKSFSFPETEFVAVTAYQNEAITKMKIDNNPFAKGFRENGMSQCRRKQQHKKLLMGAKEYLAQDSPSPPPQMAGYLDDSGVSSLGSEPASPSCSLTSSPPPTDTAPTTCTATPTVPFLSITKILEPDYRPLRRESRSFAPWCEEAREAPPAGPSRLEGSWLESPMHPTTHLIHPAPVALPSLPYPWYGPYHSYPYTSYPSAYLPALQPACSLPRDSAVGAMDLSVCAQDLRSKEYRA